jgi:hypothetical protein
MRLKPVVSREWEGFASRLKLKDHPAEADGVVETRTETPTARRVEHRRRAVLWCSMSGYSVTKACPLDLYTPIGRHGPYCGSS